MLQSIERIDSLENKSEWLKLEVRNYKILYNAMMTNFDVVDDMLSRIKESEISNSSLLSTLKAGSFTRANELKNAEKVLNDLSQESEISVEWSAHLLSITKGHEQALNYLFAKMNEYPNNEYLQLLYNRYLVGTDQAEATKRAYKLGLDTNSTYIVTYSIEVLMIGGNLKSQKTMDEIGELLGRVLYKLDSAEDYIDYYLLKIAIPDSEESSNDNIIIANEFNPMNYYLLTNQYYMTSEDKKLGFLKKIEKLDPYSNSTLVLLADYYAYHNMVQELKEVKQRFNDSKRFKTKDDIDFINNL